MDVTYYEVNCWIIPNNFSKYNENLSNLDTLKNCCNYPKLMVCGGITFTSLRLPKPAWHFGIFQAVFYFSFAVPTDFSKIFRNLSNRRIFSSCCFNTPVEDGSYYVVPSAHQSVRLSVRPLTFRVRSITLIPFKIIS